MVKPFFSGKDKNAGRINITEKDRIITDSREIADFANILMDIIYHLVFQTTVNNVLLQ